MLPETSVNKDESEQEWGKSKDGLYSSHWVQGITDLRSHKEQLPNLESVPLLIRIFLIVLQFDNLVNFTLNIWIRTNKMLPLQIKSLKIEILDR